MPVSMFGSCEHCKKKVTIFIGQRAFDRKLMWSLSYKCSSCGNCVEMDDVGYPPDYVREAIILALGKWGLLVNESELKKTKIVSIIRKALNLPISEIGKLIKQLPGVVLTGTQDEMEWLKQLLEFEGLKSSIIKTE